MVQEKFIQHIQFEKRYSNHTITAYKKDIEQFYIFLKEYYEIIDEKKADYLIIRSWIVKLMENGLSTRSINRKLSSLKTFFKYLIREEIISINPMLKITSPKTSKRLPEFVEKNKIDYLLNDIDFGDDYIAIRDKTIFEVFYATGIRTSELINLKEQDVDLKRSTIKVIGKRNKERIIPFSNKLSNILNNYIEKKHKEINSTKASIYLFVTQKKEKMYAKLVYKIINSYLNKVTTLSKKSPHVLRHTFATHMLNNGADLNAIKELLGHSNLSSTQVYTHNTIDRLKSIYNHAHPKEQKRR
ncbi:MAG: tyrosine-type recombinase/integrase [Bacteroidales bacterium]|nr:tyrosine-type recombinase/integrase [Bacteroidales bacterium]